MPGLPDPASVENPPSISGKAGTASQVETRYSDAGEKRRAKGATRSGVLCIPKNSNPESKNRLHRPRQGISL